MLPEGMEMICASLSGNESRRFAEHEAAQQHVHAGPLAHPGHLAALEVGQRRDPGILAAHHRRLAVVHLGEDLRLQPPREPVVHRRRADVRQIDLPGHHRLLQQRPAGERQQLRVETLLLEVAVAVGDQHRRVRHRVHPADADLVRRMGRRPGGGEPAGRQRGKSLLRLHGGVSSFAERQRRGRMAAVPGGRAARSYPAGSDDGAGASSLRFRRATSSSLVGRAAVTAAMSPISSFL